MSVERFDTRFTATLGVRDWPQAVEFYQRGFGAELVYSVPGGGVGRLSVNGAEFWVAEESPEHQNYAPASLGGCSVRLLLIVEDVAAMHAQALAAGATEVYAPSSGHGWLVSRIIDPEGHHWEIGRELV